MPDALAHEQKTSHYEPGHEVEILPGTRLHDIVGKDRMQVNTSHHQAVKAPGRSIANAVAPGRGDRRDRGPDQKFCIGVQWHPEYLVDAGDMAIFQAMMAACNG